MTVYVDSGGLRDSGRTFRNRPWCHLLTDDPTHAELHELADRIGLRRERFQRLNKLGGPLRWWQCHYGLTGAKRREAIAAGAVEIRWNAWPQLTAGFRADAEGQP